MILARVEMLIGVVAGITTIVMITLVCCAVGFGKSGRLSAANNGGCKSMSGML